MWAKVRRLNFYLRPSPTCNTVRLVQYMYVRHAKPGHEEILMYNKLYLSQQCLATPRWSFQQYSWLLLDAQLTTLIRITDGILLAAMATVTTTIPSANQYHGWYHFFNWFQCPHILPRHIRDRCKPLPHQWWLHLFYSILTSFNINNNV